MKRKSQTGVSTKFLTYAALIAAIYVVLTYLTNMLSLSSGAIQCRLSEALCVLPAFTIAAIPGLFVGCFISNFLCGCVVTDVVFGSIATLIGAVGTYYMSKYFNNKYMLTVPPIVSNALIVPFVLKYAYGLDGAYVYFVATVGLGEIISCGVLGTLLYSLLKKKIDILFK